MSGVNHTPVTLRYRVEYPIQLAPLGFALLLFASPLLAAESDSIEQAADTTEQSTISAERQALTRHYLLDQQYLSHSEQRRSYDNAVGQAATNRSQVRGHRLAQQQGGVEVGALVSETDSDNMLAGSNNRQFAPQSNTLMIDGDNNAPIQLSNISANGGNVHIGDVNKGNLHNSQIGSNQQGGQSGNSVNHQGNQQSQQADTAVSSQDAMSQ